MNVFKKTFNLLPTAYKKKSTIFVVLFLFASFLEALGIGLILPILSIIIEDGSGRSEAIFNIMALLNIQDSSSVLLAVILFFIFVYIFKNFYLIFFYYWQNKFTFQIYKKISVSLFKSYITEPISFHFSKNSSELIRNVFQECKNFSVLVNSYLKLIAEFGILLSIVGILLFFEPKGTIIIILIISFCSLVFTKLTKKKIYKLGQIRQEASGEQLKMLQQGFGAIKDIKLKSAEAKFLNDYELVAQNYIKASYLQSTISEMPKIWLEVIFVISLSVFLLLLRLEGFEASEMFAFVALFAGAAFRIIPSVNRIIASLQSINFNRPSLEKISERNTNFDKSSFQQNSEAPFFNFKNEIKLENLTFSYNNQEKSVIKNLSMTIKKNDYIGIIGKSGVGKSTIIDIVMGLIKPNEGKVLVDNANIHLNIKGWQKRIGYVSQSIYLIDDTIKNNIAFGIEPHKIDNNLIEKVSKDAQILDFIKSLKNGFETKVGERGIKLSGGQIQRIGIARELYLQPELLIFDEATSALDKETELEFLNCLESLKNRKTIIFVSHRKSALKNCNKITEID